MFALQESLARSTDRTDGRRWVGANASRRGMALVLFLGLVFGVAFPAQAQRVYTRHGLGIDGTIVAFEAALGGTGVSLDARHGRITYSTGGADIGLVASRTEAETVSLQEQGDLQQGQELESLQITRFGPTAGGLLLSQEEWIPIAVHTRTTYQYQWGRKDLEFLDSSLLYSGHLFRVRSRIYHAFDLGSSAQLVPQFEYTPFRFTSTTTESEDGFFEQTSTTLGDGGSAFGLGLFIGSSDFGVHIAAFTNGRLQAGLRF